MGRTLTESSSNTIVNTLTNGQLLQAKSGYEEINVGDVVSLVKGLDAVVPVMNMDHVILPSAGDSLVPETVFSSSSSYSSLLCDHDGSSLYVAAPETSNQNMRLSKYSQAGELISYVEISSSSYSLYFVDVQMLSDGNILVAWGEGSSAPLRGLYFSVYDKNLMEVVSKTLISATSANPGGSPCVSVLKEGGFAVAFLKQGEGAFFSVYSNSGDVLLAPSLLSVFGEADSGNSLGPRLTMEELSNGTLMLASVDTYLSVSSYIGLNASGGVEVPYRVVNNDSYNRGAKITVHDGYFALMVDRVYALVSTNDGAHVFEREMPTGDDGVFAVAESGFLLFSGRKLELVGFDGDVEIQATTELVIDDPVYVDSYGDVVVVGRSSVVQFFIRAGDGEYYARTVSGLSGIGVSVLSAFAVAMYGSTSFSVLKTCDSSVLGVSQTFVPSGAKGTNVSIVSGPGGFPTNPVSGSLVRRFDHSNGVVVGNRGVIYRDSVVLEGVPYV